MTDTYSGDKFNVDAKLRDQVPAELDFETLRGILQSKGIVIERTKIAGQLPDLEDIRFDQLSDKKEGMLLKNLKHNCVELMNFLNNYFYLIDDFGNDNTKRLEVRDQIAQEVGQRYGENAQQQVRDIYMHSKMRNNVLVVIRPTIEQIIRIIGYNPAYPAEKLLKLQGCLAEITGENDPQNYEGQERLEKVRRLDGVLENVFIELKSLSEVNQ